MAHHKSTIKRARQNVKRAVANRASRSAFRTSVKKVEKAVATGDLDAAQTALTEALQSIGNTERKGLIHQNKASRHASRLTRKVNALAEGAKSAK